MIGRQAGCREKMAAIFGPGGRGQLENWEDTICTNMFKTNLNLLNGVKFPGNKHTSDMFMENS